MQSADYFILTVFALALIYCVALMAAIEGYTRLLHVMTALGLAVLVIATVVNIVSLFKSQ